jgi:hypothetical protein
VKFIFVVVTPAKAGVQWLIKNSRVEKNFSNLVFFSIDWMPAFAGMTTEVL